MRTLAICLFAFCTILAADEISVSPQTANFVLGPGSSVNYHGDPPAQGTMSFAITTGFSLPESFTYMETPATLTSLYMVSDISEFYDANPAWTSGCGGGMYDGSIVGTTPTEGILRINSDHTFRAYFPGTPVQITLVRSDNGCTVQFGASHLMVVYGNWNDDGDHFFDSNAIGVYGQPEPTSIVLFGSGLLLAIRKFRGLK